MGFQKPIVISLAALFLGAATVVPAGARADASHMMYLTFNRPVALPGVALGAGTYIFEIPVTGDHRLVRVSNKNRSIVYLTAFTELVERPAGMKPSQVVSFAEAASDRPQPIDVWWARDGVGRQFKYPKK